MNYSLAPFDRMTWVRNWWSGISLSNQFALAGSLVVFLGMLAIGIWVSRQIEEGVTKFSSVAMSLYVDGHLGPLAETLMMDNRGHVTRAEVIGRAFRSAPLDDRIVSLKVWKLDGTLEYSAQADLIGKKFEVTPELTAAAMGQVVANFDDLGDDEDAYERSAGLPLLEIYAPVRSSETGNVIAVVEFYADEAKLGLGLQQARWASWAFVSFVMIAMAAMLMWIVIGGSRTINQQRVNLSNKLREVLESAQANLMLRERMQRSSGRVTELNEQYLKKISAELHDGPAQLVSYAALRMDSIDTDDIADQRKKSIGDIKGALEEALHEIRDLCRGLTLPEISGLTVNDITQTVANVHTQRTGTNVELKLSPIDPNVDHAVKICIYRFVQECLNNSYKHAEGYGQAVEVVCVAADRRFSISVSDKGVGMPADKIVGQFERLGLVGLRERIQSIGGNLDIESLPGEGTKLIMHVSLDSGVR